MTTCDEKVFNEIRNPVNREEGYSNRFHKRISLKIYSEKLLS